MPFQAFFVQILFFIVTENSKFKKWPIIRHRAKKEGLQEPSTKGFYHFIAKAINNLTPAPVPPER